MQSSTLPCAPNMVAFTVDRILSCVPIVGILSQTCNRFCKQMNSEHQTAAATITTTITFNFCLTAYFSQITSGKTNSPTGIQKLPLPVCALDSRRIAGHLYEKTGFIHA